VVEECRDRVTDSIHRINDSLEKEFDRLYSYKGYVKPGDYVYHYVEHNNGKRYAEDTSLTLNEYVLKNKYTDIFSKILFDGRYGDWSLENRFGCINIDTIYSKNKFVISVYTHTLDHIMQLWVGSDPHRYGYYKLNRIHFILMGDNEDKKLLKHLFRRGCNKKKFIFDKDCYKLQLPCPFDPFQWYFLYDNGNLSEKNWDELWREHGYH